MSTALAGFSFTVVDCELLFEVSRLSVAMEKVFERGATLFDRASEYKSDGFVELGETQLADFFSCALWGDACNVESFASVDIPYADHSGVVHDVKFYCSITLGAGL